MANLDSMTAATIAALGNLTSGVRQATKRDTSSFTDFIVESLHKQGHAIAQRYYEIATELTEDDDPRVTNVYAALERLDAAFDGEAETVVQRRVSPSPVSTVKRGEPMSPEEMAVWAEKARQDQAARRAQEVADIEAMLNQGYEFSK